MIKKTNFADFMKSEDAISINRDLGDYSWDNRKLSQMNDVWGEVNRAVKYYKEWKNGDNVKHEYLMHHLDTMVHYICFLVHSNPNIADGIKAELRAAQWELYDFLLWDNERNNDVISVMHWFDQWNDIDTIRKLMDKGKW